MTDTVASRAPAAEGSANASAQARPSEAPPAAARRRGMGPVTRLVLLALLVLVLALGAVFGMRWWTHGRFIEGTNDAYLRADAVSVAAKVGGYVQAVYVADNQPVSAGQPLLRIDAANFDAALAQQQGALQGRQADVETARAQVDAQGAQVAEAQAALDRARINAAYAAGDAERYRKLAAQGVETTRTYDTARHTRDEALAVVKTQEATLAAAQRQAATVRTQVAQASASVEAQTAAVRAARINLGDTEIRASAAGRIGDKSVRVGQFVQPGQRLMSVVPVEQVYLVANFKETQIARMRVGQHAQVKIDALGGETVDAVLDSFAPGTGAQFALLPPENATGNFTKIVQRIPVRFRLQAPAAVRDHLLPGLSANVSVDTTQGSHR